MNEAPYSLNLPLPKDSQYDASGSLTIRGETFGELSQRVLEADLPLDTIMSKLKLRIELGAESEGVATPVSGRAGEVASSPPTSVPSGDVYYCKAHPNAGPCKPVNRRDRKSAYLACPIGYGRCKDEGGTGAAVDAEGKGISIPYDRAYDRR